MRWKDAPIPSGALIRRRGRWKSTLFCMTPGRFPTGPQPCGPATLSRSVTRIQADVFVEIADCSEEQKVSTKAQLNIRWLRRNRRGVDSELVQAAKAIPAPASATLVFAAAESSIEAIRRLAAVDWNVLRDDLHASGYWKYGEPDHKGE